MYWKKCKIIFISNIQVNLTFYCQGDVEKRNRMRGTKHNFYPHGAISGNIFLLFGFDFVVNDYKNSIYWKWSVPSSETGRALHVDNVVWMKIVWKQDQQFILHDYQ